MNFTIFSNFISSFLVSFFLLTSSIGFSQTAQFDTLHVSRQNDVRQLPTDQIIYPLIKTEDEQIDSLINWDMMNKLTHDEYPDGPMDSTLSYWISEIIVDLNYEVTYNRNGLLSLRIHVEGCGAHCSNWTEYFNYSLKTGKALYIGSVIDTSRAFKKIVNNQIIAQYLKNEQSLKGMIGEGEDNIDEGTFNWAMEYCEPCKNNFKFQNFALYPNELEIIHNCELPHAIRAMAPIFDLKYQCSEIRNYLKIKF